ncbi:MAG: fliH [Peptococcaceae bacterium]|nr:fliH [Peptococcaceae bacterium]
MSKIIKANFVKNELRTRLPVANNEDIPLTRDTAQAIYLETKVMIEELIAEAQQKADEITLKSRSQAQMILETAHQESQDIKNRAYEEGYRLGYEKGLAEARHEIKELHGHAQELIGALQQEKLNMLKAYESELLDLVMLITEKILGVIVEVKPEIINGVISRTLSQTAENGKIMVKVNPFHIPYLNISREHDNVVIQEDVSVKPGGCVIISENGIIDAQLEGQIALLKQALRDVAGTC